MTTLIPALPTPVPQSADPLNFAARADAFLAALPGFAAAANAQAAENNAAGNSAALSGAAAQLARDLTLAAIAAGKFDPAANYTAGALAWSPVTGLIYRRLGAGKSAADPGSDTANWLRVAPESQDEIVAALKFALDQAALANYGVRALRQQAQQQGEITIINRGVVSGCAVSKSTTAARNLSLAAGVCFAHGRAWPVAGGDNAASVPANTGAGPVTVYAYLFKDAASLWKLAVTPIGSAVPNGAITIYSLTIPSGSTDASDPNLANVKLTDARRIEAQFPQLLGSPASASPVINTLSANDYSLSFDVAAATGAPCDGRHIVVSSRATNGFTVLLASAADNVALRWRLTKLNN
ncbi:MAG: hypothetical protein FWG56_10960 [Desulfovibrionaceae bacterium]|nr:hypothetical protein [Desulfovibrionaceae bacterium]